MEFKGPDPRGVSVFDHIIRFFLYVLIFWIPYSNAVVEVCVVTAFVVWVIKRFYLIHIRQNDVAWAMKGRRWIEAFCLPPSPINFSIGIFIGFCLLSVVFSHFPQKAFQAFLTKVLEWYIVYFLVLEVFRERKHLKIALYVFCFTALATIFDGLFQFYVSGRDIFYGTQLAENAREGATAAFDYPNSFAAFLTISWPLFLSFIFLKHKNIFLKVLFGLLWILNVWAVKITFSDGGLIVSLVATLIVLVFLYRKIAIKVCLVGLIGTALVLTVTHRIPERLDENTLWRMYVWKDSLEMLAKKPFLGHGLNTYMELFQQYRRSPGTAGTYAHNCYLQMLVEIGIFGLTGFVAMIIIFFMALIPYLWRSQIRDDNLKIIVVGLLAGLAAFLLHSTVDVHFYSLRLSVYFWFVMGIVMSSYRLLNPQGIYGIKARLSS